MRLTSMALEQSKAFPGANEATLNIMGKFIEGIHTMYHHYRKTKNGTVFVYISLNTLEPKLSSHIYMFSIDS